VAVMAVAWSYHGNFTMVILPCLYHGILGCEKYHIAELLIVCCAIYRAGSFTLVGSMWLLG